MSHLSKSQPPRCRGLRFDGRTFFSAMRSSNLMRHSVFLLLVLVAACAGSSSPDGRRAGPSVLPAGGSPPSASSTPTIDLSGTWVLQPSLSYDPVIEPPQQPGASSSLRGGAFGRGRRGRRGFGGGLGLGNGGRRGSSVPRVSSEDDRALSDLLTVTVLEAQRLVVRQGAVTVIARGDEEALGEQRQFWQENQLVVIRQSGRLRASERYTLSPDGSNLHVAITVHRRHSEPLTYVRQFKRAEPVRSSPPAEGTGPTTAPSKAKGPSAPRPQ